MGVLEHGRTGRRVALTAEQVVGRSEASDVSIDDTRASGTHARIRWTGGSWEVRDLGSRNGTWVDGQRVEPGPGTPMPLGCCIAFGGTDDTWKLLDDEPPCAFLQPLDGGPPRLANGDVLAPGPEAGAETVIHRKSGGGWVLDDGTEARPLRDRDTLTLGGRRFLFRSGTALADTHENEAAPPRIAEISLTFSVSQDEEHVQIAAVHARGVLKIPPRRSGYVLLMLARHRLEDRQRGVAKGEEGWTYTSDLVSELGYETEQRLNLDIFRLRELFSNVGIENAHDLVERRRTTGQLRLGVEDVYVNRA